MYVSEIESFRESLDQIRRELRLPMLYWDDDGSSSTPRNAVAGEDLYASCWEYATRKGIFVDEIEPMDVKNLAWRIANDTHDRIAGKRASTGPSLESLKDLLNRLDRTVRLLPEDPLTRAQRKAILSRSLGEIAKSRGCRLSSACNLKKRALRNLEHLARIDDFLFGDWRRWFEREASTWRAGFLRQRVWPLVKPGIDGELRDLMRPRQNEMFEHGTSLLAKQSRLGRNAVAEKIAQGYHLCVTATYIDRSTAADGVASLCEAVAGKETFFVRIGERCLHLLPDEEGRLRFLAQLQSYMEKSTDEGRFFARYAAVYYGATDPTTERRFLGTRGNIDFRLGDASSIVREIWENLGEFQYKESSTLDDTNFLRCVHILRSIRFTRELPKTSRNLLRVVAQHARKSSRKEVVAFAKEVESYVDQRVS